MQLYELAMKISFIIVFGKIVNLEVLFAFILKQVSKQIVLGNLCILLLK